MKITQNKLDFNQSSTWFLRAVLLGMVFVALALCIYALPSTVLNIRLKHPLLNNDLLYLFTGGLYFSAISFFVTIYQSWKLLNYIDKDLAFSQDSVNALNVIKYAGIGVSIGFGAAIPFIFFLAELDDSPGLGLVGLIITSIPLVISTFAAVLQRLLQNVVRIKSENDLTV